MEMGETLSVRALLLDERLETRGLERDDTLATNPFTLRAGRHGGVLVGDTGGPPCS